MPSSESSNSQTDRTEPRTADIQATVHPWRVSNTNRVIIWMLRLLLGGVFVMSGLTKSIDLWGFLFKLEEYLGVWHITQPRSVAFMAAMLISGYEFVLGALLMLGCYKRVSVWGLTLTMVVMLPLTLYLWIADPVSDCGCFGDFLKLSNGATFLKNVVITAGLLYLIKWNARLKESLFNPAIQWIVGALITLYILIVGLYGYNAQPMADFRAFPVGTQLLGDGTDESDDFLFIYEKDGHTKEFTIDNLPDSTWEFVDRIEQPSDESGSHTGDHLAIFDGDDDVTAEVIEAEGEQYLLVIPEPRRADISNSYTINEIKEKADSLGIPFIALLGTDARGISLWTDVAMAEYPCYSADDTQLKELVRGNISLVMLRDGVVESKTTVSSMMPEIIENPPSDQAFTDELKGYGHRWFTAVNGIFGFALLLIYLFQGLILAIRLKIKSAYRRKHAKKA